MAHAKIAQPQQTEKSDQQTVKQDSLTLGQHLSAVLNSPDLPGDLHTRIWDCLGDIPTGDLMDEPDFLDKLLKVGQAKAQKPTPAAEASA